MTKLPLLALACVLAAIALLVLASTASAQGLPNKPIPNVRVNLIDEATNRPVTFTLPVKHRTADRSWWTWTIVSGLLMVADNENTQYVLHHVPGSHEQNPLLGQHPSRARMYLTFGPPYIFATIMSYREKRRQDAAHEFGARTRNRDLKWWFPQAANSVTHGIGVAATLGQTGR